MAVTGGDGSLASVLSQPGDNVDGHRRGPSEAECRLAGAIFHLIRERSDWIARRFESIEFINRTTIRVTAEIHFDLDGTNLDTTDGNYRIMPVARSWKSPHTSFEVWDAAAQQLSRLNRNKERRLVAAMAVNIIREEGANLGGAIGDASDLEADLYEEVPGIDSMDDVATFFNEHELQLSVLPATSRFALWAFLAEIQEVYWVLVVYPRTSENKGIITLRSEEYIHTRSKTLEDHRNILRNLAQKIGRAVRTLSMTPSDYRIGLPEVGECASYHVELLAPPGLVFQANASFEVRALKGGWTSVAEDDDGLPSKVHIYYRVRAPLTSGRIRTTLIPTPGGQIRSAMITSGFLAAVILSGFLYIFLKFLLNQRTLSQAYFPLDKSSSTALLLLVPGICASIAWRSEEHDLTSRALLGLRMHSALAALLSFVAAVTVAFSLKGSWLLEVWLILATLSVTICFRVVACHESSAQAVQQLIDKAYSSRTSRDGEGGDS